MGLYSYIVSDDIYIYIYIYNIIYNLYEDGHYKLQSHTVIYSYSSNVRTKK